MTTSEWQSEINESLAEVDYASRTLKSEQENLVVAEDHLTDAKEAQILVQQVAQVIQAKVHAKIAGVVSSCLASVFPDPYEFHILFDRKNGRTSARLVFMRDGNEIDPMKATGGGYIDVAAFALRVACLLLSQPALRKVLILDEAFRFVSAEYQDKVAAMMEGLAQDLGIQFIMVTHNEQLIAGNVIQL